MANGKKFILAMDQGTTSSRSIVFDQKGGMAGSAQYEFPQIYPKPGFVEQSADDILSTQLKSAKEAIEAAQLTPSDIAAIGITNQRETVVAWQRSTGKPVYNALVWQCRRGAALCEQLTADGYSDYIRNTTGLLIDSYFSATKIKWLIDNVPAVSELLAANDLCFGTVDSWLIFNLTGGAVHRTDITNASRTMLFDIHRLCWDEKLLALFRIPESSLPSVLPSSGLFGYTEQSIFGVSIPITGVAGDQHAAMFGQCCFEEGVAKSTYGTGCFILMNTGSTPVLSESRLLTTIAWQIDGEVTYALEGSAFNAGSAIKWLRDEVGIIKTPQEADLFAEEVSDSAGMYFVPAFTGLGAPYWDMYARGALLGITRGANKKHIARAVLESIAMQCVDLFSAMQSDSKLTLRELRVDGGVSNSVFVMQLQSDLLGIPVLRPQCVETTAIGAAFLAGLAAGVWSGKEELRRIWKLSREFTPAMDAAEAKKLMDGWRKAVGRSMKWEAAD
ncbi:MAG: glycerol kinase GlpK [Oscillospiraceae bacterium]|jgi:glycerol kinase|nr:glycerol kinase GlpK [Oscillospiraceae bacterium]